MAEIRVIQVCNDDLIAVVAHDGVVLSSQATSDEAWEAWYSTPKDSPENIQARAHNKWLAKLEAIKKALQEAIDKGAMTQEEAEAALQKWLDENPDPDGPPIDVTEAFAIPVKIGTEVEHV